VYVLSATAARNVNAAARAATARSATIASLVRSARSFLPFGKCFWSRSAGSPAAYSATPPPRQRPEHVINQAAHSPARARRRRTGATCHHHTPQRIATLVPGILGACSEVNKLPLGPA
jgi:hypothetical protein